MAGYYQTPNVMVPLNKRERGEVADIAIRQLAVIQNCAITWPVVEQGNENRCGLCSQNLWFRYDTYGEPYGYSDEELLALKVAHIRQNHQEAYDVSGVE
jgi:hypothetical protein